MSKLIRTFDDPILKVVCAPVEPGESVDELKKLMLLACTRGKGVGLAAPQVGIAKRMVMSFINCGKGVRARFFINPIIVAHSEAETTENEGCLSYPGIVKRIARWTSVSVTYQDLGRNPRREQFYGYAARVMQHEIDHLDGICRVGDDAFPAAEKLARGTNTKLATAVAIACTGVL